MGAFVDEFDIDEKYHQLRKLVDSLEPDLYKFVSPTKNKSAAIRARKNLGVIKLLATELRKAISKQRNHNNAHY